MRCETRKDGPPEGDWLNVEQTHKRILHARKIFVYCDAFGLHARITKEEAKELIRIRADQDPNAQFFSIRVKADGVPFGALYLGGTDDVTVPVTNRFKRQKEELNLGLN